MGNKSSKSNSGSNNNNSNNSNNNDRRKGPIATASPLYATLEQTDEDLAWDLHNRENLAMGRETHAMYGHAPPPIRRPLPPLPPPDHYSYGTWNAPPPYQEVIIHNDDDAFVAVFLLLFFFFWLILWLIIAWTW
jgi:hypothetical protein